MANLDPDLYPKLTIRPGESRFGTEKKKNMSDPQHGITTNIIFSPISTVFTGDFG
jgi:hypothetical protein